MHYMRVGGTIMGRKESTGCHKVRVVQDSSFMYCPLKVADRFMQTRENELDFT